MRSNEYSVYEQWPAGVPLRIKAGLSDKGAVALAKKRLAQWELCNKRPRLFTTYRDGSIGWDSGSSQ